MVACLCLIDQALRQRLEAPSRVAEGHMAGLVLLLQVLFHQSGAS